MLPSNKPPWAFTVNPCAKDFLGGGLFEGRGLFEGGGLIRGGAYSRIYGKSSNNVRRKNKLPCREHDLKHRLVAVPPLGSHTPRTFLPVGGGAVLEPVKHNILLIYSQTCFRLISR